MSNSYNYLFQKKNTPQNVKSSLTPLQSSQSARRSSSPLSASSFKVPDKSADGITKGVFADTQNGRKKQRSVLDKAESDKNVDGRYTKLTVTSDNPKNALPSAPEKSDSEEECEEINVDDLDVLSSTQQQFQNSVSVSEEEEEDAGEKEGMYPCDSNEDSSAETLPTEERGGEPKEGRERSFDNEKTDGIKENTTAGSTKEEKRRRKASVMRNAIGKHDRSQFVFMKDRTGLVFPVGRIRSLLKDNLNGKCNMSLEGSITLAAAMEFFYDQLVSGCMGHQLLDGGNGAKKPRTTVSVDDLKYGISQNPYFKPYVTNMVIMDGSSGCRSVIPSERERKDMKKIVKNLLSGDVEKYDACDGANDNGDSVGRKKRKNKGDETEEGDDDENDENSSESCDDNEEEEEDEEVEEEDVSSTDSSSEELMRSSCEESGSDETESSEDFSDDEESSRKFEKLDANGKPTKSNARRERGGGGKSNGRADVSNNKRAGGKSPAAAKGKKPVSQARGKTPAGNSAKKPVKESNRKTLRANEKNKLGNTGDRKDTNGNKKRARQSQNDNRKNNKKIKTM